MTEDSPFQTRKTLPRFDEEAQKEYFAAKEILGGEVPLTVAAQFWADNKTLRIAKATTVEYAVNAVIKDMEDNQSSLAFLRATRVYFIRFIAAFGKRSIAGMRGDEISKWINEQTLSPRSKYEVRSKMSYLFRRAKALNLIDATPVLDKELLPKIEPVEITALSTDEMREFLKDIAANNPKYLPNFVLRAFGGLRASEAEKMRWEWIDEANKRFVIPGSECKNGKDWVFEPPFLPETLFVWLKSVPAQEKKGKIPAPTTAFLRKLDAKQYPLWRKNIMRHTFCAMQISLEQNADRTALLLRHHGSPTTLYKRYENHLVPAAEAKAYFDLKP